MTGGVAHDFNNLLQVIVSNLGFLAEDLRGDEDKSKMVEVALEAAERGSQVTSGLLAFSRQQRLEAQPVDVAKVVQGSVRLLRSSLAETMTIATTIADDLPAAMIDPGHLQNAIVNLAVNARDAMPGGGELSIELARSPRPAEMADDSEFAEATDFVVITVSDSGAGIAPENLAQVIEPFFTTKGMSDHSGLGLSMVHGFTQQSGGHFEIESVLGEATKVRLFLPVATQVPTSGQVVEDTPSQFAGSETILLVEDDRNVRQSLVATLERRGYALIARENGAEGLRYLETHEVDLLITDVVMPGRLSGPELAIEARKLQPHLKVILISGYAEVPGLAPGDVILGKPVIGDKLALTVREILDGG